MKRRDEGGYLAAIAGVFVMLFMFALIGVGVWSSMHTDERVCTVEQKERIYAGKDKGVQQRLYTTECGVMEVGDSLFDGHFDSADTWAGIEEGHTYRMKTRGVRVGFFSMFPNVVEAEEVAK